MTMQYTNYDIITQCKIILTRNPGIRQTPNTPRNCLETKSRNRWRMQFGGQIMFYVTEETLPI